MVTIINYTKANEELFNLYCIEECKTRKKELENEITETNIRLISHVANKYANGNIENFDNFFSMASIGFIKAIRSFKLNKKIKFATYAGRCMENEVLMSFRTNAKERKMDFISLDIDLNFIDSKSSISEIIPDQRVTIEDTYTDSDLIKSVYKKASEVLTEREMIIFNNFLQPKKERLTQRQMGKLVGVNQSYISRIETSITVKISTLLKEEWGEDLWKN